MRNAQLSVDCQAKQALCKSAKRLLQQDQIAVMFLRLGGEKMTRLRGQICVNQTPKKHTLTLQEHHTQQRGISGTTATGS